MNFPGIRTAGDIADGSAEILPFDPPTRLGPTGDDHLSVSAAALGQALRAARRCRGAVSYRHGWYEFACPDSGVSAASPHLDELTRRVVAGYRRWARTRDVETDPVAWLVLLSDDDELTGWVRPTR